MASKTIDVGSIEGSTGGGTGATGGGVTSLNTKVGDLTIVGSGTAIITSISGTSIAIAVPAGAGTGSVTQVDTAGLLLGGPITTTGTLTVSSIDLTAQVTGVLPLGNTSSIPLNSKTVGSLSLSSQVSGSLPLSQTSGSVSLTNQVSGVLPLANTSVIPLTVAGAQVSGSISLTTQVVGVLPLANTSNIPLNSQTTGSLSLTNQVVGNLPVTNLNSGTSASGSTFWRGDATWATPAGGGGGVGTPASVYSVSTGSFVYSVASGTVMLKLTFIAGGGGGGGCGTSNCSAAGGGGGGGGGIKWLTTASMTSGTTISGTIGDHGPGGASGANNGTIGGNTFVVIGTSSGWLKMQAYGGQPGDNANYAAASGVPIINGASKAGGTCSSADINAGGVSSGLGLSLAAGQAQGAFGGSGAFAWGGGGPGANNANGTSASGPGGGGGGASNTASSNHAGGDGGQGIVVIETYN